MYGTMAETNDSFNVFDDSDEEFDYLPLPDVDAIDGVGGHSNTPCKLPYKCLYNPPLSFDSTNRRCFIPHQKVNISINHLVTDSSQLLNPHLYHIEVSHGEHQWLVMRRYKDFQALHNDLLIYKTKTTLLPLMSKEARDRRKLFAATNPRLSRFPKRPDALIRSSHQQQERKQQLQAYLESVLSSQVFRAHPNTLAFLDVSDLSFVSDLGHKRREGMVRKKGGGRRFATHCCSCCLVCVPAKWLKRWLVLKDSFVAYVRPEDGRVSDVLLMDQDFKVNFGVVSTGWRKGLLVTNLSRHLRLKCSTQRNARVWYEDIKDTMQTTGNDFTQANRFRSFVPVRSNTYCNWYVDGASYMAAVADAMDAAKEEIFITDWMLSPELYMKRPFLEGDKWRIDQILKRKAEQGVRVFILVFKELEMALGINSMHTKQVLSALHPTNIKVLRHPDGISMWSHHEKSVVVDQKIAFVGGIDLCYGRWDTRKHRLTDLGTIEASSIFSEEDENRKQPKPHPTPSSPPLSHPNPSSPLPSHPTPSQLSPSHPSILGDVIVAAAKRNSGVQDDDVSKVLQNGSTTGGYVNPMHADERFRGFIDQPPSHPSSPTPPQQVNLASPESSGDSPDQLPSTLQSFLDVAAPPAGGAFQPPSHAIPSPSSTTAYVTPEKDDEKSHIKAFKAYMEIEEPQEARKRGSHRWLGEMRKAYDRHRREERRESEKSESDSDVEVDASGRRKRSMFAWVGDKMRFGGFADDMSDHASDTDTPAVAPVAPASKKTTNKHMVRNIANMKMLFHRHQSQVVDVSDDAVHRPWNDKILPRREADEVDQRLDDKLPPEGAQNSLKVWVGKDYCNFIIRDFAELDNPFADLINRREIPRMPWHDIASMVSGKAARDVARHFIQRWNFTKQQKVKANTDYPFLLPKSNSHVSIPKWITNNSFCADCQVLRSACEWSAGIKVTENSIHNAYTHLIMAAEHFIYIENQFFISIAGDRTVSNQITAALYERIVSAHRAGKRFRVYVMIPLLPCFEGQLGTASGAAIQAITHWNYASICRGNGNSLLERLLKVLPDPFQYISFYCLRRHDDLLGKLTTELIYVHAKLMIVDDRSVIIGSANINDRSLLGTRDSELAVVVHDSNLVPGVMDGQPFQVGSFASSLRKSLMREHLGPGVEVADPVAESFYKGVWMRTAALNTSVYWNVFQCIPADDVTTLEDLRTLMQTKPLSDTSPEEARELLREVRGHLVLLPLQFLSHEDLVPPTGSKEALIPTVVWT